MTHGRPDDTEMSKCASPPPLGPRYCCGGGGSGGPSIQVRQAGRPTLLGHYRVGSGHAGSGSSPEPELRLAEDKANMCVVCGCRCRSAGVQQVRQVPVCT